MYYNTSIKYYNSEKSKSIRYVIFPSPRYINIQDDKDNLLPNYKRRQAMDMAETLEALRLRSLRDFRQEALSRACRTIKHIIRLNYSNRLKFLTLTYSYVVKDKTKVLSDIKNMCKRFQAATGSELKYIATLEYQKKRECLHVHMIIDSPFISTDQWHKLYWLQGFVKINTLTYGKSRSDCVNAINYALKYIKKDFDTVDQYEHVYYRSRNWNTEQKKEYDIALSRIECLLHAQSYLKSKDYSTESFEFELWNGEVLTVLDVYSDI